MSRGATLVFSAHRVGPWPRDVKPRQCPPLSGKRYRLTMYDRALGSKITVSIHLTMVAHNLCVARFRLSGFGAECKFEGPSESRVIAKLCRKTRGTVKY